MVSRSRSKSKGRKRSKLRGKKSKTKTSNRYAVGEFRLKKTFFGGVAKNQTPHAHAFIRKTLEYLRNKKSKGVPKDSFESVSLITDYLAVRNVLGERDHMVKHFMDGIVSYYNSRYKDDGAQNLLKNLHEWAARSRTSVNPGIRRILERRIRQSQALDTIVKIADTRFRQKDPREAQRLLKCHKIIENRRKLIGEAKEHKNKCKLMKSAEKSGVKLTFGQKDFLNRCDHQTKEMVNKVDFLTSFFQREGCGVDPDVQEAVYKQALNELREFAQRDVEACKAVDMRRSQIRDRIEAMIVEHNNGKWTKKNLLDAIRGLRNLVNLIKEAHRRKLGIAQFCPSLRTQDPGWTDYVDKALPALIKQWETEYQKGESKPVPTSPPSSEDPLGLAARLARLRQSHNERSAAMAVLRQRRRSRPTPPPSIQTPSRSPSIGSQTSEMPPRSPTPSVSSASAPESPDMAALQREADDWDPVEEMRVGFQRGRRPSGGSPGGIRRSASA